jgi:hypothetical protein
MTPDVTAAPNFRAPRRRMEAEYSMRLLHCLD